jgi:hypothetical protein
MLNTFLLSVELPQKITPYDMMELIQVKSTNFKVSTFNSGVTHPHGKAC